MQVEAEFRTSVRDGSSSSATDYIGGVVYFFEYGRVASRSGAKGVTGAAQKIKVWSKSEQTEVCACILPCEEESERDSLSDSW